MSTQHVNVARFARNFKWDFFCNFQTLCRKTGLTLDSLLPALLPLDTSLSLKPFCWLLPLVVLWVVVPLVVPLFIFWLKWSELLMDLIPLALDMSLTIAKVIPSAIKKSLFINKASKNLSLTIFFPFFNKEEFHRNWNTW